MTNKELDADDLSQTNPHKEETPIWWALEGWRAAKRDWVELAKTIEVDIEEINVAADIEYSKHKSGRTWGQIRDAILIEAVIHKCVEAISK